jgi:hypothetical protein
VALSRAQRFLSWGYRTLWSVVCGDLAPYWLWRPLHDLSKFPSWSSRSSIHRRPRALFARGSSSYELQSTFRVSTKHSPPPVSRPSGSFLEVSCLIAPSASRVRRHDGFHATAAVRPRVFSTPRRFAPHVTLRACFIPLARPGFSLQGVSLVKSLHGSSPRSCLRVVTAEAPPLAE